LCDNVVSEELDMGFETVDLGDLAFSSYIYCQFTGYDRTYSKLLSKVGGDICLSEPSHGAACLELAE
jgi:hypothetical protein